MSEFKILVIEDDAIHRTVVQSILEEEGYRVITAIHGEDGIKKTFEYNPDLVITDIKMPIKDGYTVCYELSENEATKYIPVVMLTANDTMDEIEYGFKQGAFDYITKPFENKELLARVNAAIKYKKLREELIHEKQKTVLLELAGGAAHELNQPLTILKTTFYLLRDKYKKEKLSEDEFYKYLDKLDTAIERMSKIIKSMSKIKEYKTKDYAMGKKIIDMSEEKENEEQ